MGILMMLIIITLIVCVIMAITCWFLVTTNAIKANRVTKLFYYDDESFIKSWEKTKGKGILMYNIKNECYYWLLQLLCSVYCLL